MILSENIIVAGLVGLSLVVILYLWRYANKLKSIIFNKLIGKDEHNSIDIDNVVRIVIFLGLLMLYFVVLFIIAQWFES